MKSYDPQGWYNLAKDLYELILTEINNVSGNDFLLPEIYPKLVVMYEFFRLVRGEAFDSLRPYGISEFQTEIYKMENDLANRLKQLAGKLNPDDERTLYYLDLMKKSFSLKYFETDKNNLGIISKFKKLIKKLYKLVKI